MPRGLHLRKRCTCSEIRDATASWWEDIGSAPPNVVLLFEYGPATSAESQCRPSLFRAVRCCGQRLVLGSPAGPEAGTDHELHDTARKTGGDLSIPPIRQHSVPQHWLRR